MPMYEFQCEKCEAEFEELVASGAEARAVSCPNCGAAGAKRRVSVFAARGAPASSASIPPMGACGRCGDPNGPCGS